MPMTPTLRWDTAREQLVHAADNRATRWRESALADLRHIVGWATEPASRQPDNELRIASVQRGDRTTAVALGGRIDAHGIRQLAAHLAGLINTGTRYLVIDLAEVDPMDEHLLRLLRGVESRMLSHGGAFELTGLAPPVLYAMDDASLMEVFTLYRTVLDGTGAKVASWATLRCPQGLDDVPEPGTANRHRAILDSGLPAPVNPARSGRRTGTRAWPRP